jgi:hypothetical protein
MSTAVNPLTAIERVYQECSNDGSERAGGSLASVRGAFYRAKGSNSNLAKSQTDSQDKG